MTLGPKVNFVVAGAQKSGTRALRHFLAQHPDIGLSRGHEPHNFDRLISGDKSDDYSGYHILFDRDALELTTGDVTPIYMYLRDCPGRMQAYNPAFKVIMILRNPIERAYSQWVQQIEKKLTSEAFLTTIIMEPFRSLRYGQHMVFSHVARGFYSRQLKRMFRHFPQDSCLVLRNEDLANNHAATLRRVYRFLGVAEIAPPEPAQIHSREYPSMSRFTRLLLRLVYWREIKRLGNMLGWNLSGWR